MIHIVGKEKYRIRLLWCLYLSARCPMSTPFILQTLSQRWYCGFHKVWDFLHRFRSWLIFFSYSWYFLILFVHKCFSFDYILADRVLIWYSLFLLEIVLLVVGVSCFDWDLCIWRVKTNALNWKYKRNISQKIIH